MRLHFRSPISIRTKPTFVNASVTFWEATAPVKLPARHCSPNLIQGPGWEIKQRKGGISLSLRLAPELPPILNMRNLTPMSSCSKASRGLFVQPRVKSIFTRVEISPSTSSRQFSSRYAIRAGRNLPDKEFRFSLPFFAKDHFFILIF